jgi:glycine cleavage system H protein
VKIEAGLAVIGIMDHAQKALGDITFLDLPKAGRKIKQGEECAVIESVKAASDIYAPVSGEVAEANTELKDNPGLVNEDAYNCGWILKLKNIDKSGLTTLLDAATYDKTLAED